MSIISAIMNTALGLAATAQVHTGSLKHTPVLKTPHDSLTLKHHVNRTRLAQASTEQPQPEPSPDTTAPPPREDVGCSDTNADGVVPEGCPPVDTSKAPIRNWFA
jgi:hypothetical protein